MTANGQLSVGSREQKPPFPVWGLTGGIAAGKSTVALLFEKEGLPVLDADRISRELSAPGGKAYPAILQRFGTGDRAELRERIFSDPSAKRDLEAILHPLIRAESARKMLELSRVRVPIVYEATLLVETGRYRDFEGLIVVEAPRESRIERLVERDEITREQAEKILAAQASDEERRKVATVVIENDGTVMELKKKVHELVVARGWDKN